jgi:AbiV family abortive infection protein
MAPTYPPLPSRDDLLQLMQEALANAKDLLNDAQLLFDASRFPRALALATLSWEELSKADLCALAMALPEVTPDYFWEHFRDHEGKLARVHAFAAFMQPKPIGPVEDWAERVKSLSKSTQGLKERSLYVDYRRRKILLPSQVTERAARKQIKAVREALDFADRAFSGEPITIMFTELNTIIGPLKNSVFIDPDATAAALQEAIRDGSQQKIQLLFNEHSAITDD